MDRFDRKTRSNAMSRIKSTGTKSTEWKFRSLLIRTGIRGWKIGHRSGLLGSPDFIFQLARVVIFVDGCFWHGCRKCRTIPETRRSFWTTKLHKNKLRDKKVTASLRRLGWTVLRFWEHDLKKSKHVSLLSKLSRCNITGSARDSESVST